MQFLMEVADRPAVASRPFAVPYRSIGPTIPYSKTPTKHSRETPLTSTMSIKQSMRDIDRAVRDAIGTRDEYEADDDGRSPR